MMSEVGKPVTRGKGEGKGGLEDGLQVEARLPGETEAPLVSSPTTGEGAGPRGGADRVSSVLDTMFSHIS